MRERLLVLVLLCLGVAAPALAEIRDARTVVRIRTVVLNDVGDPDAFAIRSANGAAPQYDSRTFLDGKTPQHSLGEAMEAQGLHLGQEMRNAVAAALSRAGYRIVAPASTDAAANADAILDVGFAPGSAAYSDSALGDDLMPTFSVIVRFTDAHSAATLYRGNILYGQPVDERAHAVFPDARYRFTSADAVLADPKSAAEGFRDGVAMVAKEIGTALGK